MAKPCRFRLRPIEAAGPRINDGGDPDPIALGSRWYLNVPLFHRKPCSTPPVIFTYHDALVIDPIGGGLTAPLHPVR